MKHLLGELKPCPLFAGIEGEELESLLGCLSARERAYEKGGLVFLAGERAEAVGIVLAGSVHVVQEDFWGNRAILAAVGPGGLFGEAFSCGRVENLPVSVAAAEPCRVLLIDYRGIVATCSSACRFHTALIQNMMGILAGKNILLTQKIQLLTRRTTREKLLAYLSAQARQAGSGRFAIPFNRQELADYLSVDRSAMSNELSKLRAEGVLSFHRSRFELRQGE